MALFARALIAPHPLAASRGVGTVSITGEAVVEGSNGGSTPGTFTVTRSGGTAAFTVTFVVAAQDGASSDDFNSMPALVLSFARGQTEGTLTYQIAADQLTGSNEYLTLAIDSISGGGAADPGASSATLYILDDDSQPGRSSATNGDDLVRGTNENNQIDGREGNDTVNGADGDDLLLGNKGQDMLLGQAGDDTLVGGKGDDRLDGGDGEDTASWGREIGAFTFARDADGAIVVEDARKVPTTDTVANVEHFVFAGEAFTLAQIEAMIDAGRGDRLAPAGGDIVLA